MDSNSAMAVHVDLNVHEALNRLDAVIKERQRSQGSSAAEVEKIICIETRSLMVVFKDFTLLSGRLDGQLARQVFCKLEESANAMKLDEPGIASVSRRISQLRSFITQKDIAASVSTEDWSRARFSRKA